MKILKLFFILLIIRGAGNYLPAETFPFVWIWYADSDKTIGSKITNPYNEIRISTREGNLNFGLSMSTNHFSEALPFTIKAGNLSTSGSISKLNNPTISAGTSPFSSGIALLALTKASLPGYTSFSNPTTIFFQLGLPDLFKKTSSLELSCSFTKNSASPVSSLLFSSSLLERCLNIKISSTGGLFNYKENLSSSWFSDEAYYLAGKHLCSLYQISLEFLPKSKRLLRFNLPALYFSSAAAFYESPYGGLPFCLRSDFKLTTRHTELYLIAFYNPKDKTITSSEKEIPSCLQAKSGLLIKSMLLTGSGKQIFLKSGLNIHTAFNFLQNEGTVKINTGFQASSTINTFSITASINFSIVNRDLFEYTGCSIQLKDSMSFKYLNIGITGTVNFTPSKDNQLTTKYKIALNLANKNIQKINGNGALTITRKNEEITSKKLSGGLSLLLKYKWIYFSGKLTADFDF